MTTVLRRRRRPTTTTNSAATTRRRGQHDPFVKKVHDGGQTFHVVLCHECAEDEGLDHRVSLAIYNSSSRMDANVKARAHHG